MKKNDIWELPYRGSRYSYNSDYIFYRAPMTNYKVMAKSWSESLLEDLMDVNPYGGSFRITEDGKVITKVPKIPDRGTRKDMKWIPYYVTEYDGCIEFADIDLNPSKGIQPGDIWPGFYYMHGSRFSLSYYDEIFFRASYGRRYYVISDVKDLIDRLRVFLPKGGRFYINENGKVWTNSEFMRNWRRTENQIKGMSTRQKNLLQQRIEAINRYPVYVCDFNEKLVLDIDDFDFDNTEDTEIFDLEEE